jgi:drug/metabolite transporter (DMT)-like permease
MNDAIGAERGLFHPRILLPFLLVSLIWGSTWFVIRDQLSVVPATWSVTYRFSTAAIGMIILTIASGRTIKLDRKMHLWAMIVGLIQFGINFNFVYAAEQHITSGLVAVLFALLIIPNALLGKLWLGRAIAPTFFWGSAIATLGVGLLILREYREAPVGAHAVLIGAGLTICAVLCASVANVIQATERMGRYPIFSILSWAMLYGATANAIWSLIVTGPPMWEPRIGYGAGILYLGLVGTVVTFPLYFGLIRDIGPGKAAYTSVLIPIVAMVLSTLFEGYHWSLLSASGAALAMVGLLIAMQSAKPARKSE